MHILRRLFRRNSTAGEQQKATLSGKTGQPATALAGEPTEAATGWDDTIEAPLERPLVAVEPPQEPVAPPVHLHIQRWTDRALAVGYASHVGKVRARNEDSGLVVTSATLGDSLLPPFGLFIVADGMGGHSEGHKASQLAARVVANQVITEIYPPHLRAGDGEPAKPVQDILREALQKANWQVNLVNSDSGTTLTAALVIGNRLFAAHVGDSRAYLLRNDQPSPELLTLDHSFVQRLQDGGHITAEEAAVHPQRNVLYRAIGQGERLDVDTFSRSLPASCWLLLCTDGLWGVVGTDKIQTLVITAESPQVACHTLVDAALQAGAPDNVTAIVIRYQVAPGARR